MINPDIIVYSGTFDPPHQGHLDCVTLANKRFPKAKILVVPGLQPAGSQGQHKTPVATFADRIELCRQEFSAIPGLEVSDVEAHLTTPNYTWQTLEKIKSDHPGKQLALLIGQDQLAQFPKWRKPEEILKISDLIVIQRHQQGTGQDLEHLAQEVSKILHLKDPSQKIALLKGDTSHAESRLLREQLAKNQSPPSTWLPEKTLRYIKDKGLYGKKVP